MRVSTIVAAAVSATSVIAHRGGPGRPGPVDPEYYSLGCPGSTKPWASQKEQLEAITEYGNLLYVQKNIPTAEYTYVATDFINHAPE